ncbi:hypothetical protein BH11ARM2_BH11ARM2_00850 [soil metagenome]
MFQVDLSSRLERILSLGDLSLTGDALHRKLAPHLKATPLASRPFRRIDLSILLIQIGEQPHREGQPYLVSSEGGRVHVVKLFVDAPYGTYPGPWRRRGDRIVGGLYLIQGNWAQPGVFMLERRKHRWNIVASRISEEEASDIAFIGSGIDRLRVSSRSYDFQALSQPHAGPLLIEDVVWRILPRRISAIEAHLRRTPLFDLDQFVIAIQKGNLRIARSYCAPHLFKKVRRMVVKSHAKEGLLNATCPYSYEVDTSKTLGFANGEDKTTPFVEFAPWRGGWRIVRLRRLGEFPRPKG